MAISREQRAFIEAIKAAPDDDAPRLLFADFLEERGDPRGTLMRDQVYMSKPDIDPKLWAQLNSRVQESIEKNRVEWSEGVPEGARIVGFDRGLLKIETSVKSLADFQGELSPYVTGVTVSPRGYRLDAEQQGRELTQGLTKLSGACIQSLHIDGIPIGRRGFLSHTRLQEFSGMLADLRELKITGCDLTDEDVRVLASSPDLANVRVFDLSGNLISREGIMAIATSPHLQLEDLSLNHSCLEGVGTALAGRETSRSWENLKSLSLNNTNMTTGDAQALAGAKWSGLHNLDIGDNPIGDDGVAALVNSRIVANLTSLGLGKIGVFRNPKNRRPMHGGLTALVNSPYLGKLETLDLHGNGLGPDQADLLSLARKLGNLRDLDVGDNPLSPAGAEGLARNGALRELTSLNFRSCGLGDRGVEGIAGRKLGDRLPIRELILADNKIGP